MLKLGPRTQNLALHLGCRRVIAHGPQFLAPELEGKIEVVLLLSRLEGGAAVTHKEEARVAQVGDVQLVAVGQELQNASR